MTTGKITSSQQDIVYAIDDDLKLSRTEIASIKEDISEFRQELRMLKDFKEFCKRFANGRHME